MSVMERLRKILVWIENAKPDETEEEFLDRQW
jgi:hypothetical protein